MERLQKNVKDRVLQAISELPTTVTYDDIFEQIVLMRKIEQGLEEVAAGHTVSQAEVEVYFKRKWQK